MSSFSHKFNPKLKKHLEELYKKYDETKLGNDPIIFPKRFTDRNDIELAALFGSTFAFGNIKQTGVILEKILAFLGPAPAKKLKKYREGDSFKNHSPLKYRIYSEGDIDILFTVLARMLKDYGSLGNLYHSFIKKGIAAEPYALFAEFHLVFYKYAGEYINPTKGLHHMFPNPKLRSACKRSNLFLRWMVRNDKIDFGLWDFISPANLIIPVDTHIAKVAERWSLTGLSAPDRRMAEQITESLKVYDKDDPVRFDFALCHTEMWGAGF